MLKEITGTVVSVKRQWWLKVNTKPIRRHMYDGALFPYIFKVAYTVDGKRYFKRKWVQPGCAVPSIGTQVTVSYEDGRPKKATVFYTSGKTL